MTTLQRIIKYCAVAFAIFLAVSIITGILGGISAVGFLFSGGSKVGEMQTYSIGSGVENLDVGLSAANLEIVTGDGFALQSNHKYLKVKEQDGTLTISESKGLWKMPAKEIKVILTLPEGCVLEDFRLTAGAGKVKIQSLSANTLRMELGAGAVEIGSLNAASRAEISGGAGMLVIGGGALHDLSLDVGVGKLEMTSSLTGDCSLDCGIGETRLTLPGSEEDYKIKLDKGIGNATLNGKAMVDDSVYGAGENRLDIDGGIGAIVITTGSRTAGKN